MTLTGNTGEVPQSLLDALGKSGTDTFTFTDIGKVLDWGRNANLFGDISNPVSLAAMVRFGDILKKYVGQPINVALPAAGKEAGTGQGPNFLPDIAGAIMFIGVILIGITFIFVGGILTLRKRNGS